MKIFKLTALVVFLSSLIFVSYSCKQLQQFADTMSSLQRLQFKLNNVSGFRLAGIDVQNKKSVSDFSITDGFNLANAVNKKKLQADFTVNVDAKNPNDGTGKTKSTVATLTSLDWRLYIDDVQTIAGNINKSIEIPGTGQTTTIPLGMSLDLYQFFGNKGYDGLINLALALGGVQGSAARLKLDAQPTVTTPFGAIQYPGRITIVDKNFTN
jgi:hypothetical protein